MEQLNINHILDRKMEERRLIESLENFELSHFAGSKRGHHLARLLGWPRGALKSLPDSHLEAKDAPRTAQEVPKRPPDPALLKNGAATTARIEKLKSSIIQK